MSELQALGEFLEKWGWPVLVALLLIVGVLVPRWVLKRSDAVADRSMGISEGQVAATLELATATKAINERQIAFEARVEAVQKEHGELLQQLLRRRTG